MKILITGSRGMLGSDLCGVLSSDNEIIGVDVRDVCSLYVPDKYYNVSVSDREAIEKIFLTERPEVVIHTAAWTDVDGCELDPEKAEEVNVIGTLNIVDSCKSVGSDLIALSTDYIFDGTANKSYKEDDEPNPLSVYGRTKLEAENLIREVLDSFVILRTSALFGANGRNFVDTVIEKASQGEKLNIVEDQITSPTYTFDLACSISEVLKKRSFCDLNVINICNSDSCSWYEFAEEILIRSGIIDYSLTAIKSDQLDRPAKRPFFSVLNNRRFCDFTGTRIRGWKEALNDYMAGKHTKGEK